MYGHILTMVVVNNLSFHQKLESLQYNTALARCHKGNFQRAILPGYRAERVADLPRFTRVNFLSTYLSLFCHTTQEILMILLNQNGR